MIKIFLGVLIICFGFRVVATEGVSIAPEKTPGSNGSANEVQPAPDVAGISLDFIEVLDANALDFLAKSMRLAENSMRSEVDLTHHSVLLRITEVLRGLSATGKKFSDLSAEEKSNQVVSLATDLIYISSDPDTESLAIQREQYLELLQISEREFEKILGEYDLSQSAEDKARNKFSEVVDLSLSYFEKPRLAALSQPRLMQEMATLKVGVAAAAQGQAREFIERPVQGMARGLPGGDPESAAHMKAKMVEVGIRSAAGYLASIPFQVYVVYGTSLGREASNPDLSKLATIAGITAEQTMYEGKTLLVVEYRFPPADAVRVVDEAQQPEEQPAEDR
jgi:hypothetical protein